MLYLKRARAFAIALLVSGQAGRAYAAPPAESLIPIFSIAKSENRNQVQYVVHLDDRCSPVGPSPVTAYWRMLETSPTATAPILPREQRAYGLAEQSVAPADANGVHLRAVLKAMPHRPLDIAISRGANGACRAMATTSIAGAPSRLFNVYIHLRWDGPDYLLLQGWSADGAHVREKITGAT